MVAHNNDAMPRAYSDGMSESNWISKISLSKRAVALPLIGLMVTWLCFMFAGLVDLLVPFDRYSNTGELLESYNGVRWATYLYLLGISVASIASLIAQGWAISARQKLGEQDALARAAHRFANFAVIVGLAAGAIFAIGNFMSGFNAFPTRAESLPIRFANLYLPIILATALVVTVLLRAFVFRHSVESQKTEGAPRLSEAQKALALGYATPILATTVAIILGLFVYDVTKTNLQTWVWVIIIAIVGFGIIAGTLFANRARQAKPTAPKPKTALAAGAATLNFVLSIVFGAVVTIMAFSMGSAAIQKLRDWTQNPSSEGELMVPKIIAPTWRWVLEEMAPAKILLLLAVVGVYLSITLRNKPNATSDVK